MIFTHFFLYDPIASVTEAFVVQIEQFCMILETFIDFDQIEGATNGFLLGTDYRTPSISGHGN